MRRSGGRQFGDAAWRNRNVVRKLEAGLMASGLLAGMIGLSIFLGGRDDPLRFPQSTAPAHAGYSRGMAGTCPVGTCSKKGTAQAQTQNSVRQQLREGQRLPNDSGLIHSLHSHLTARREAAFALACSAKGSVYFIVALCPARFSQ
jgi:hypothetical protein